MLHIIVFGIIEEDPIVCGFADIRPFSRANGEVIVSKSDDTSFNLLAHFFSNGQMKRVEG
jgi:hypothetical protein